MKQLSSIVILLLLCGCEQTMEDTVFPSFQEKLIVAADITVSSDSTIIGCNVSKTLPLNEPLDYQRSRVHDAEVRVVAGGTHYQMKQGSRTLMNIEANYSGTIPTPEDHVFSLEVRWHDKVMRGKINIPGLELKFDTLATAINPFDSSVTDIFFRIKNDCASSVYVLFQQFDSSRTVWEDADDWFFEPTRFTPCSPMLNGFIRHHPYQSKQLRYRITLVNMEYREYASKYRSSELFGTEGKNPKTNMTGDGLGFISYTIEGKPVTFFLK